MQTHLQYSAYKPLQLSSPSPIEEQLLRRNRIFRSTDCLLSLSLTSSLIKNRRTPVLVRLSKDL